MLSAGEYKILSNSILSADFRQKVLTGKKQYFNVDNSASVPQEVFPSK